MTNRNSPPRAEGAQGSFDSGAKRRAVPGRGLNSNRNYDQKLFQVKAPSGDRPTLMPVGDRRSIQPALCW